MSDVGPEGRSFAQITYDDLRRLAAIAETDREAFFAAHPDWAKLYRDRLLAVALCQGAAAHFVDGKRGINDFDVYTFYAAHPDRPWYAKRNKRWDFGDPKFGKSVDRPDYLGRRVDLLGRGIPHLHEEDPAESICRWVSENPRASAKLIAQRPIVLLFPIDRIGEVIWSPGAPSE